MGKILGYVHMLVWRNPYTQPPDGFPRVLAEVYVPCSTCPSSKRPEWVQEAFEELAPIGSPMGSGYCNSVRVIQTPPREFSRETKAKIRVTNLQKRMRRKWGWFAEEMIAEELARRPEYYSADPNTPTELARREVLDRWREEGERHMARPNELIIHNRA